MVFDSAFQLGKNAFVHLENLFYVVPVRETAMQELMPENRTTDRSVAEEPSGTGSDIVLDVRTGEHGTIAEWREAFVPVWANPKERLERLLALLSDDVTLRAPTVPPVSHGKAESRKAFQRALEAMPDLCADVHRWSYSQNAFFIEMTFHASIGEHRTSWNNVDRFLFRDGVRRRARRAF